MAAKRPNVLFIMSDQHRFDYLGCAGADWVRTPVLDRLASEGTRFTHCITNSPLCAPARMALATGLLPHRLGGLGNDAYLPAHRRTMYQHFRDHGYRVGCVGKLDLAKPDPYNGRHGDRPRVYGWGFTHPVEVEGKAHAGQRPYPVGPYTYYLQERGKLEAFHQDYRTRKGINGMNRDSCLETEEFADSFIGRRAAQWIEEIPDDFPWFLFVSFVGPHSPFDPPAEYARKYRGAPMPPPLPAQLEGKPEWVRERVRNATPEQIATSRRQYSAVIELIDDQIGRILAALDARGMREETIILFTSDHGEMVGDFGLYGKGLPYEASIRVPLIIAGPQIPKGEVRSDLVELIDLNPTVVELAGLPEQPGLDARSIAPLMRAAGERHREEAVSLLWRFSCLRTERYKLVDNVNHPPELYDLQNDPEERVNIAEESPKLVKELQKRLKSRLAEGEALR